MKLPDRIADRFEVIRSFREDAAGAVLHVQERDTGRAFVLKWIATADARTLRTASAECALLRSLDHPNLTRNLEFDRVGDGCYLLREYVEGTTLAEAAPSLAPNEREAVFRAIVRGLAFLHGRGLVHGDLKPENVLVRRDAHGVEAILTDFGFSERIGALSHLGAVRGTPPFIAPEILLGVEADARADLFALGVTWLAANPACPPIDERRLYATFPRGDFLTAAGIDVDAVDPDFAPILRALLATAPSERLRSARDLLARLGDAPTADVGAYARLLRPSSALFAEGKPCEALAIVESMLQNRPEDRPDDRPEDRKEFRSVLLVAATAADAREAEQWVRFEAARSPRPAWPAVELETRARTVPTDASDPSDGSDARHGRDAGLAREIVSAAAKATLLLPPAIVAIRQGSLARALALAARIAGRARVTASAAPATGSSAPCVVAIVTRSSILAGAGAGANAPHELGAAFDRVIDLPAIDARSLARDLARVEGLGDAAIPDRLERLADNLLALAGPDGDAIAALLETGLAAGSIVLDGARLDLSRFQPRGPPPGQVERMARRSLAQREALAAIEMFGRRARPDELVTVLGPDRVAALSELRAEGVVVADGRALRAEPAALSAVARDTLGADERIPLATRVAVLDSIDRKIEIRALVLLDAGETAAAERALENYESSAAEVESDQLARLAHALRKGSPAQVRVSLALSRRLAGEARLADAIAVLLELEAESAVDEAIVSTRLGLLLHASGRSKEAALRFEHAKHKLREKRGRIPARLRRDLERGLALVRAANGDVAGAIQHLQLALRGSHDEPDADDRALAVLLGGLALRDGRFATARRTLEATVEAARKASDSDTAAAAATNLATLEQREGHLDRAIRLLEEALAVRAGRGELYEEAIVRNNLGLVLRENGDLAGAKRELEEAHALRLRMGDARGAAATQLNLAGVATLGGDLALAQQLAGSAIDDLRAAGVVDDAPEMNIAAARVLEIARAAGGVAAVRALVARIPIPRDERPAPDRARDAATRRTIAERILAESALLDDADAALRLAREAVTAFEQAGDRVGLARGLLEVARRALEAGDPETTRRELAKARRLGPPRLAAELHLVAGTLAAASGATDEARSEFDQARSEAARAGLQLVRAEALVREINFLASSDPAKADSRRVELRALAPSIRLPDEAAPRPLDLLRRIFGRLVAPDFRVETNELETHGPVAAGRVLTEGIPEEVFRTFVMINRSVMRETDVERLLERLLEHAVALSGARRGFVVLLKDGRVLFEAKSGELEPENEEISRGIVLEAIQQMRPLVTANARTDSRLTGRRSIEKFDLRSVLCVPFRCFSGTEGAIYVDNPVREGVFGARAVDFLEALASQAALAIGNLERQREISRLNVELSSRVAVREAELDQARRELVKSGVGDGARRLIAQSESMRQVVDLARRVAKSDLPVLILGESGTGKEMIARFVHEASSRCARSFVAENCSAIPETLLESEFFGCVKGAFTGADQDRDGLFQQADGGTLFLDEIGDMPLSLQSKLLRVIQERAVRKVGANHATPIDVRLVCATHRDVDAMVAEGKFREDLFYRVRGIVLKVPPLRQRPDDVPPLVDALLARLAGRHGATKRVPKSLLKKLMQHDWPGNVRELESEVTRLYHLSSGDELDESAIDLRARSGGVDAGSSVVAVRPMAEIERDAIQLALRETNGNREEAARRLEISRAAFYVKLKAYGLQESNPSSRRKKS